jgi:hypothetical protein
VGSGFDSLPAHVTCKDTRLASPSRCSHSGRWAGTVSASGRQASGPSLVLSLVEGREELPDSRSDVNRAGLPHETASEGACRAIGARRQLQQKANRPQQAALASRSMTVRSPRRRRAKARSTGWDPISSTSPGVRSNSSSVATIAERYRELGCGHRDPVDKSGPLRSDARVTRRLILRWPDRARGHGAPFSAGPPGRRVVARATSGQRPPSAHGRGRRPRTASVTRPSGASTPQLGTRSGRTPSASPPASPCSVAGW